MKGKQLLLASIISAVSFSALAATCPTNIQHNDKGYWYSKEQPGWKSVRASKDKLQIDAKDFAGIVYSPKQDRLACVYKTKKGWIALVSNVFGSVKIDSSIKDDSGRSPAWRYDKKHKDYTCGMPYVNDISKCQFSFQIKHSKKQ